MNFNEEQNKTDAASSESKVLPFIKEEPKDDFLMENENSSNDSCTKIKVS